MSPAGLMLNVWNRVKWRQLLSSTSLSRNSAAERVDERSTNLKEQLVGKGNDFIAYARLWTRALTRLTLFTYVLYILPMEGPPASAPVELERRVASAEFSFS